SPANNVLIAGGGPLVDLIRKVDQPLRLDAEKVHWACISVLAASARLMAALLPEANLIESYAALRRQVEQPGTGLFVFSVEGFLRIQEESPDGLKLPYGWEVTSDSIAASLAAAIDATELVLLKSTDLPSSATRASAAASGLVDEYFPIASQKLAEIRWVNLRDGRKGVGSRFIDKGR
ncbi:MAG: hypothetical protein ACC628_25885, partial [Pirellulaceae bacterium]